MKSENLQVQLVSTCSKNSSCNCWNRSDLYGKIISHRNDLSVSVKIFCPAVTPVILSKQLMPGTQFGQIMTEKTDGPMPKKMRQPDKLINEPATGKQWEKVLR